MHGINTIDVGKRLKSTRQSRNMTLDAVSELTGVSKPMIGQIERGQSSPTVNTLWKIATGLKIPFSVFLQEHESEYTVVDLQEENMISEENGKMRVYTLFSFDPSRNFEVFYIEFDSGCSHCSNKHDDCVEEYIFVIQGKLDMSLNGTKITLKEKQSIRFKANIPHSYINPYEDICKIYNIIFYQN